MRIVGNFPRVTWRLCVPTRRVWVESPYLFRLRFFFSLLFNTTRRITTGRGRKEDMLLERCWEFDGC